MPGTRCTDAEASHRVEAVASMLAEGLARQEIVARCAELWGISASQADRYARAARERLAEASEADTRARCAVIEARYERLWGQAVEAGDTRTALAVVKAQAALYGLGRARPDGGQDEDDPWTSYYAAMAAFSMREYARALAKALTREQADAVLAEARSVGAAYDLSGLVEDSRRRIEEDERRDALLLQCVRDHEELGRGRTRQELIDDGLIPASCGGGDGPGAQVETLEQVLEGAPVFD